MGLTLLLLLLLLLLLCRCPEASQVPACAACWAGQ
jgi:hypothetical protein